VGSVDSLSGWENDSLDSFFNSLREKRAVGPAVLVAKITSDKRCFLPENYFREILIPKLLISSAHRRTIESDSGLLTEPSVKL